MLPSSVMYSAALAYMGEAMLSLLTEHGLIVLVMSHANSTAASSTESSSIVSLSFPSSSSVMSMPSQALRRIDELAVSPMVIPSIEYLYQSEAIDDIPSLRSWILFYNSNRNASGEDSYFGIY